jgi:hypothetical protein
VYTFLNDIDGGGDLYFSKLNVTIPVKQGTSVFFHTARVEDGNMNVDILHEGLPVVGKRDLWVAVKWVCQPGVRERERACMRLLIPHCMQLRNKDFRANFPRIVVDYD